MPGHAAGDTPLVSGSRRALLAVIGVQVLADARGAVIARLVVVPRLRAAQLCLISPDVVGVQRPIDRRCAHCHNEASPWAQLPSRWGCASGWQRRVNDDINGRHVRV